MGGSYNGVITIFFCRCIGKILRLIVKMHKVGFQCLVKIFVSVALTLGYEPSILNTRRHNIL